MEYKRRTNKSLIFNDHPEFQPNLTPKQIFESGSFGGTYFRQIYSTLIKKRPASVKGQYIEQISISSTMGPGVKIDQSSI